MVKAEGFGNMQAVLTGIPGKNRGSPHAVEDVGDVRSYLDTRGFRQTPDPHWTPRSVHADPASHPARQQRQIGEATPIQWQVADRLFVNDGRDGTRDHFHQRRRAGDGNRFTGAGKSETGFLLRRRRPRDSGV